LSMVVDERDNEQDEPVVVLSVLSTQGEKVKVTDVACYAETEAHVLKDIYSRVVLSSEKKKRGTARRKVIDISSKKKKTA
jgi:hypothetical protein